MSTTLVLSGKCDSPKTFMNFLDNIVALGSDILDFTWQSTYEFEIKVKANNNFEFDNLNVLFSKVNQNGKMFVQTE